MVSTTLRQGIKQVVQLSQWNRATLHVNWKNVKLVLGYKTIYNNYLRIWMAEKTELIFTTVDAFAVTVLASVYEWDGKPYIPVQKRFYVFKI